MAWICLGLLPLQTTKKSANEVTSRKSSTQISVAFFDSAARTAVSQGGVANEGATERIAVLLCSRIGKWFSYSYATLNSSMRQIQLVFLCLGAVACFGQAPDV